jgi:DmsE family decaheme c-type cytochrome
MAIISILAKAVEKTMKRLHQLVALCAFILACGAGASAVTAAEPGAVAKAALERDAVCTACHNESWRTPVLAIYQTKHGVKADARTPGCTTCHGASEGHLKQGPGTKPDVVFNKGPYEVSDDRVRSDQCMNCHRGKARTNWDGGQHQSSRVACNDCHKVHAPNDKVRDKKAQTEVCFTCHKEQRAQSKKLSTHPIEVGKVVCSNCHNPHGSSGPNQLRKNTVNETCFTCHADKRGPFLFEHQPVVENCAICHTVHGSNITPLLRSRPPFMCDECHDGTHASGTAPGRNAAGIQAGLISAGPSSSYTGRACMNCHSLIHGSNAPSGGYFQR